MCFNCAVTSGKRKDDLKIGIDFFEKNEKKILSHITKSSYYYNLANAKAGLIDIYYSKNKGVPSFDIVKDILQPPINLYWIAYKNLNHNNDTGLSNKILINIANSLRSVGRVVEAIQFFETVLRIDKKFPQALISQADSLKYLSIISNCSITPSMYGIIYQLYENGISTNVLPVRELQRCLKCKEEIKEKIELSGFNIKDVLKKIRETENEYKGHTQFRQYCIDNFLTLNEHAIYCGCEAAKRDNLTIGVRHGKFKIEIVPKLELLLNRIKSEFALARWLFYQSQIDGYNLKLDSQFTELFDGEIITPSAEMLRTGFRTCYGILDKIAIGICKLFNLAAKDENVHFESFWNPKNNPKRWEEINRSKNFHLRALYSVACDLNTNTGELKHFKNWRNKLEHNILVLKDIKKQNEDVLKIFKDTDFIAVVDIEDFRDKTLQLLQLTRAAIFSFVFCVRIQTIERLEDDEKDKGFSIGFKR